MRHLPAATDLSVMGVRVGDLSVRALEWAWHCAETTFAA